MSSDFSIGTSIEIGVTISGLIIGCKIWSDQCGYHVALLKLVLIVTAMCLKIKRLANGEP